VVVSCHQIAWHHNLLIANKCFKMWKYLGTIVTDQNCIQEVSK
jgi:hypothetical protein